MDQQAAHIIEQLLSDDLSDITKSNLEQELKNFPGIYATYKRLELDKSVVFMPSEIPVNPYLFQKIKQRMQPDVRSLPATTSGKHSWVPYAAIISFGIVSGVFLGNQVEVEPTIESDEISNEFIISDYELEETYLMDYSNEQ